MTKASARSEEPVRPAGGYKERIRSSGRENGIITTWRAGREDSVGGFRREFFNGSR